MEEPEDLVFQKLRRPVANWISSCWVFRSDKDREMTIVIGNMDVIVMLTEDQLIRVLERIVYKEIRQLL